MVTRTKGAETATGALKADKFAPEVELMLCSTRTNLSPPIADRIRELIVRDFDWPEFLRLVSAHGVRPLVYRALQTVCWDAVPEFARSELAKFFALNQARSRFLTAELLHVIQLFETEGIPIVPLKGPFLASSVYGDLALREYTDLDILVRNVDFEKSRKVLSNLGYRSSRFAKVVTPDTNDDELYSPASGITIELHWQFAPRRFVPALDPNDCWNSVVPTVFMDRRVLTFSGEDMFLFLTFHGGKHCWSSLKWLCDLAEFIRANPALDWTDLLRRARRLGIVRSCRLAIVLATQLLQAEVPSPAFRGVAEDSRVMRLARDVRLRIENPREVDPLEGQCFNLRLKERLRDKVRYVVRQCTHYSGAEERFVSLPPALSFVYVLVRPVWLLRHYGRSIVQRLVCRMKQSG
jgi:hypothetical protein